MFFDIMNAMKETLADKITRFVTLVLVLGVIGVGLLFMWPTYLQNQSLRRQDAELARRIVEKHAEIAELVDMQRRFKTDSEFVEQIARQNRRVFPGEIVFMFERE